VPEIGGRPRRSTRAAPKPAVESKTEKGRKTKKGQKNAQSSASIAKAATSMGLDLTGLITQVRFGAKGDLWLQTCGVGSFPSASQLALLLMNKHQTWFDPSSESKIKSYTGALGLVAKTFHSIDAATQKKLKAHPWLLAFRQVATSTSASSSASSSQASSDGALEQLSLCASIVSPRDCVLNDDQAMTNALNPWTAPEHAQLVALSETATAGDGEDGDVSTQPLYPMYFIVCDSHACLCSLGRLCSSPRDMC
jgi:hypothetical protein